jgi:hypothetical protein
VDIPVDEDFSKVSHSHWEKQLRWTDILVILVLLLVPIALHQGILFASNDHLLSLTIYLVSLAFLAFSYKRIKKGMHLDVFYISSVSKPNSQISHGVVWGLLGAIVPILLLILAKQFGYDFSTRIAYLLPFGVEPKSDFPKVMRVIYLVVWGFQFCLMMPLVEARYFMILLRRTASNTCITLLIFGALTVSHFYLIFVQVLANFWVTACVLLGLVLFYYLLLAFLLRKHGVICSIICQMTVNIGITVALSCLLSSRRFAPRHGLHKEQFSERNLWEILFRGVIQKANDDK